MEKQRLTDNQDISENKENCSTDIKNSYKATIVKTG